MGLWWHHSLSSGHGGRRWNVENEFWPCWVAGSCETSQGKCPGSNWKYMSKPWGRQMSRREVGVRSIEKMVKVIEDLRQPNQKWAQLVKNPHAMQETPVWFLGWEDPLENGCYPLQYSWASLMAQMVKNLPAMWETWVQSLGWENPLDEGMATHSSILAWRIPLDRGAWWAAVHGVAKSRTWLSD